MRLRPICNVFLMIQAGMLAGLSASAAQLSSETYDDVWKFAEWYENDESGFVRSVRFSGRFQYEFAAVDADEGSHEEWNVRRMRLGVKSALFGHLTVHVEAEFNPQERDPFYARFTDLYVEWSRNDWLALTVGKQSVGFTMDGQTSSKELLTIDRSNLANNLWFPDEYIPGASASGQVLNWVYGVGAYSAGEANRELGRFSGSVFGLLSLGYDFSESLGVEDALLRGNYVYQNADNDNTFTRPFRHVASGNFQFAGGRWGFRADVASGAGYLGQSDLLGVTTMPYFDITPKLQLVGRHTWLASEAPNGVRLARYESQAVSGRGDRYNELYLGVNYYFYGHKLKLQSGVQWADMDDLAGDGGAYSGVSSTTGLRVSW